jgi:hypothetical protein
VADQFAIRALWESLQLQDSPQSVDAYHFRRYQTLPLLQLQTEETALTRTKPLPMSIMSDTKFCLELGYIRRFRIISMYTAMATEN